MKTRVTLPCATWAKQLAVIHPDDLTREERAALDAHVQTCADCAAVHAEYRQMDANIQALPSVTPLPELPIELRHLLSEPGNAAALQERITTTSTLPTPRQLPLPRLKPRARRWTRLASAIAAVLVIGAIVGGFALLLAHHQAIVGGTGPGQVIFVASRGSDGAVFAVRPSDGTILWQYTIGQKLSSDLVALNGSVYASAGNHAYALNASDGSLRWTSPFIRGGALPPLFSDGNALYLSSPGAIFALSQHDGHVLWSRSSPGCITCSAAFAAVQDGTAYAYLDGLYALQASDGKVLWHHPELQFTTRAFAVAEGKLYVPEERAGKVAELQASDGTLLHTFTFLLDQPIEMIVSNGNLYVESGGQEMEAIHISDDSVLWQKQPGSFIFGLSAADNGGLYFAATTTAVSSLQITSSSGSPTAEATPSMPSAATTYVYAVNTSNGTVRWHWQPSNNAGGASNVLALNGTVYVSVGNGLYALSASNSKQLWVVTEQSPLSSPVTW